MNSLIFALTLAFIYHAITIYNVRGIKFNVKSLCVGAVICALTILLSAIIIPLPTGAVITCGSLLPIMVISATYDYRLAILCGYVCGALSLILLPTWQPVHWAQIAVEHLICFSCLGYAGRFGDKKVSLLIGAILAVLIQLCGHTISGVIFYAENAWDGWGTWAYSIIYNFTSRIPEQAISVLILLALPLNRIKNAIKKQA